MKKALLFVLILMVVTTTVFTQENVSAPQKFALVIGNGNYSSFGSLPNAINDANDMAGVLRQLGFTVETIIDGSRAQMAEGIIRLKNRLSVSRNSYGFFYYAGHGLQHNGVNFLIPSNANIPSANFLGDTSISVQTMLAELNDARNELNIVVLDACRDFPAAWSRSMNRGLAVVSNQPADSIIVYATSAGSVASDGTGRNGLFTGHLLTQLRVPGLSVRDVFDRTGAAVTQASNRQQIPAVYTQYFGSAYLGTRPAGGTTPPPTPTPQPTPQPTEVLNPNYVRIPGGTFTMGSPANEPGRIADRETPQHQVTVSSFIMSKYLVTQREWFEVMGTTVQHQRQRANASDMRGEGDEFPIYYVSWFEAVEYCNRLSAREGLTPAYNINGQNVTIIPNSTGYRLPTEAQWEYACRAGTTTAYSFGAGITTAQANFNNSPGRTTPVGSYAANPWGLFDMHGNVWEWCWDWYGGYPARAQQDPMGASSGSGRVIRGGSWGDSAAGVRSAARVWDAPSDRGNALGFRVVRP